ncbi:MAG: RidA family protein [Acidimicrobiales bacterium]
MTRRYGSGTTWEAAVGYSRAVRAGPLVFVAGTTATVDGRVVGPGDAYAQTVQALNNVEAALGVAGATLADVVQTRLFVTDIARWEDVGRAHAEYFSGDPPVSTMVEVCRLIDPDMVVEIEAVAYVDRQPAAASTERAARATAAP